jgi:hypothetical protein
MRNFATGSIEREPAASGESRRDRLTEVVCIALVVALATLAGRIVALW